MRLRKNVEVKQQAISQWKETYLCRAAARTEKKKAIDTRFSTRMEGTTFEKSIAAGSPRRAESTTQSHSRP
jgi:hypothetical protein